MGHLNIDNRTIFCHDNLDVMRGINSDCIDLIYLDPPFNKNKVFTAPIGSSAEGASFKDWFRTEDVKDEWLKAIQEDYEGLHDFLEGVKSLSNIADDRKNKHYLYNYCYLTYMAMRLIEMRRILKETGSLYLHCDPTMSHYLKILMDIIFGEKNFRNEIVWHYPDTPGRSKKYFPKKHDLIYFYSKDDSYTFYDKGVRVPILEASKERYKSKRVLGGREYLGGEASEIGKLPESVWRLASVKGNSNESTSYPTQKPLSLLERIISASSKEGDLVLDPFCGCATTCIAAEKLHRQWIGIDVSIKAYELVKKRLQNEVKNPEDLTQYENKLHFHTDPPKRTDSSVNGREKKFVYIISNKNYPKYYKVGIAKDWKARLNSYQTSDPHRAYNLEYYFETEHYRAMEKHVHDTFESIHEWVRADLDEIINEMKNFK